ncbi:MAG: low specificity L-threonine aldolase [Euryarchaeota archaeon]|nr:low specificity L-threonine aldolase [Euryarchaeota archaeon]|tara:strand:+ start:7091 stop:8122 length:1032 start_codon:yes stop_codon:yes gene_type:complete
MVDLRSDTVTKPTDEMRQLIATAKVGDDVLGDDPTIIALQNMISELLDKEAALFVPSGTMSNAIAIRTHTKPGDEIITESTSHIYIYEGGGYAALSGCSVALVPGKLGIMTPEDVEKAIRKSDGSLGHFPNGSLVCVENTSNRGGGTCYSQENLDAIAKVAHENDCAVHMDGARLFNAAIATGTNPARIVRDYDSISICLSKGLGSPVGSLLVGSSEFIAQAHRWRKMFGGGMRQAGVIAAAGIYALEHNISRLDEDHKRANKLAIAINEMDMFSVNIEGVQTNMVYIEINGDLNANQVVEKLAEHDVHVLALGDNLLRAVTHIHITDEDINKSINAFKTISS